MAGIRWDLPGAGTPGFPKDGQLFCKGFLRWILARLWPFFVGRGTVSSRFSCGMLWHCLLDVAGGLPARHGIAVL